MKLVLINECRARGWHDDDLQKILDQILRRLKRVRLIRGARQRLQAKTMTLLLVGPKRQRALNRQFRQKGYVADILSFSPVELLSLGELSICVERVRADAKKNGVTVREQMLYLFLHGFLHLLGYEHEQGGAQERRMYALQDQIFSKLRDR